MHIRETDEFHVGAGLEDGLEALQCCVDCAAQRGGGYEVDLVVVREGFAQLGALLVAEVCEERVVDDMVGSAEVVDAL